MKNKRSEDNAPAGLRRPAQGWQQQQPPQPNELTPEEIGHLLHELQVHQVELETQNVELRRAQEELAASREKYFNLYDLAPVGYVTINERGIILEANLTAADLLDIPRAALIKKPITRFILKEDQDSFYLHRKMLFEQGGLQTCELHLLKRDGDPFWARLEARLSRDDAGAPTCQVILSNISESKRAEEELRRREKDTSTLVENATDIIARFDTKLRCVYCNPEGVRKLGIPLQEILGKTPRETDVPGELADLVETSFRRALETGEKVEVERATATPVGMKYSHTFIIPERDKTGKIETLLGITRDITNIKHTEDALRLSEEKFSKAFHTSPDSISISRVTDGMILDINPGFTALTGYTAEEAIGKTSQELNLWVNSQDRDRLMQGLLETGQVANLEAPFCIKNGQIRIGWLMVSLIDISGERCILAFIRDITDQKHADQVLHNERDLLRRITDTSPVGIAVFDAEGQITFANARAAQVLNLSEAEIYGRAYNSPQWRVTDLEGNLIPDEQLVFNRVMRDGQPVYDVQQSVSWQEGRRTLISINAAPLREASGQRHGVVMTFEDITERIRVEETLRRREKDFSSLVENSPDIITRFDANLRHIYCNRATVQQLGFPLDMFLGKTPLQIGIPPQMAEFIFNTLRRALDTGLEQDYELGIPTPTGFKHYETHIVPERDAQGKIESLLSITWEITRRKQAEEKLQHLNRELEQRVAERTVELEISVGQLKEKIAELEQAQATLQDMYDKYRIVADNTYDWEFWRDEHGQYLYNSPACQRITGYAPQDFIDNASLTERLVHPDDLSAWQAHRADEEALKIPGQIEFRILRADGSPCWIGHVCQPVFDNRGNFMGYRGNNRDISQRKQAEGLIRSHIARSDTLLRTAAHIGANLDLKTMLDKVCQETAKTLNAPAVNIFLYNEQSDELNVYSCFGYPPDFEHRTQLFPRQLFRDLVHQLAPNGIGAVPDMQVYTQLPNVAQYIERNLSAMVGAVISNNQNIIGFLCVFNHGEPHFFEENALILLRLIADQVTQAVVNARLFEQVSSARKRLSALSRMLIDVQEAERRTLALELHDELGQMLSSTKMSLDMIPHVPPEAALEHIQRASALVGDLIALVRRMALDLRPSMLDDMGLLPALRWLFKNYQSQSGEPVVFEHTALDQRFPPQVEITAYRIIQGALTNVMRHAGDRQVYVNAWADECSLNLQVKDFGVGFDPAVVLSKGDTTGLSGMRERARLLGGEMAIESTPGSGTCLTVWLPLQLSKACGD